MVVAEQPDVDGVPVWFGRYRLVELLGNGGMAESFRAVMEGPHGVARTVVLKRILPRCAGNAAFVKMLMTKARIWAMLRHTGIVKVFDFGEIEGVYYLAMEYVNGITLAAFLSGLARKRRHMPVSLACSIIGQVADALAYVHAFVDEQGRPLRLVHRDVSHNNIMISCRGIVKLLDFGNATAGVINGKFAYMSPEQADGRPIDHRSDVFSLGVVFYECLTGTRLFARERDSSTMSALREMPIPSPGAIRPDVPPAVDAIVMKMLERDPADRYPSCRLVSRDLIAAVGGMEADLRRRLFELSKLVFDTVPPPHDARGSSLADTTIVDETTIVSLPREEPSATAASSSMTASVWPRASELRLIERIATGGMAKIYRAIQSDPVAGSREVAIKVIRREFARHPVFLRQFRTEAELAARLSHPNLARIHGTRRTRHGPCLVMEYLDGANLRAIINARGGSFPAHETMHIALMIGRALAYLHERHIVHRDLSPSNIMLTVDGEVKLIDFGIAKELAGGHPSTTQGRILGKLRYMSPEQIEGGHLDERSDQYSLGVLLYEMLSGRPLFNTRKPLAKLIEERLQPVARLSSRFALMPTSPAWPDFPDWIDELLATLLQVDRERRLTSCKSLVAIIEEELEAPLDGRDLQALVAAVRAPACVAEI
jgi:serine/threonine-protein kinase